jgi:hypothetical protein
VQCIELGAVLAGLELGGKALPIDLTELAAAAQLHATTTPGQLNSPSGRGHRIN